MQIVIASGTLTKDEQFELGKLLLKAGYTVSRSTAKVRNKSAIVIKFENQEVDSNAEDLS